MFNDIIYNARQASLFNDTLDPLVILRKKQKEEFEKEISIIEKNRGPIVYQSYKLTHQGIINYKTYENCTRKISHNSLANLLNTSYSNYTSLVDGQPFDNSLGIYPKTIKDYRNMDANQKRQCRKMCNKLTYYTKKRAFKSKKSGHYYFKIAFLTLTAPVTANELQLLKAFDHFLDYLRRTANCVYVWKKEIGSKGEKLHFHIMLNNFIPYYIVDWKWKRLLLNEGVVWSKNEKNEDTKSHYRIELPKNAKQTASYISKYMGKDELLPNEYGYIWGCSQVLKELKEIVLIEGEVNNNELWNIIKKSKTIATDFVNITCCDLMKVKNIAPGLYKIFEKQFFEFQLKISLKQRFMTV